VLCEGAIQYRVEPRIFSAGIECTPKTAQSGQSLSESLLAREFRNRNKALSLAARIWSRGSDKEWKVVDGRQLYLVRLEGGRLNVYDGSTARVDLTVTTDSTSPERLILKLENDCPPSEKRLPRLDSRMAMRGDHIKSFLCSKFLWRINATMETPKDSGGRYEASFVFSRPKWMYNG
jgi:hypothetical protein